MHNIPFSSRHTNEPTFSPASPVKCTYTRAHAHPKGIPSTPRPLSTQGRSVSLDHLATATIVSLGRTRIHRSLPEGRGSFVTRSSLLSMSPPLHDSSGRVFGEVFESTKPFYRNRTFSLAYREIKLESRSNNRDIGELFRFATMLRLGDTRVVRYNWKTTDRLEIGDI